MLTPEWLRAALGMPQGGGVNISVDGEGLHLVSHGTTARLVERDGHLVAVSETIVDDDMVFALIDSARE
ncbi:MAG: AbrB/MazE/SpoVT family DNA-binding domain-containing protein [Rhodoglobus sp.]